MQEVSKTKVLECLTSLGIQPGDGLLVHSAVQFLGKPVGGPGMYLEAIQQAIGPQGTIAVPAFNFGFAKGEPFDPQNTPSQGMGVFSEYVRQHPQARRTAHPMQSLAVIGRWRDDLVDRDTPSAFEPGSAFERILDLNFKLLLLGANDEATSMFHISEQRAKVPYRYWKDFEGDYLTAHGWVRRTYRMFARLQEPVPQLTVEPVVALLKQRQQWREAPLNYGRMACCRVRDFVAAVDHYLLQDPWSLVVNRADFETAEHTAGK